MEHGRSGRSNSGELPRFLQAESGASANTHMGVFYVQIVCGSRQDICYISARQGKENVRERKRELGL
jgi:hypothetical protein